MRKYNHILANWAFSLLEIRPKEAEINERSKDTNGFLAIKSQKLMK